VKMRLLLVSAVLASTIVHVSPGICADASPPDGSSPEASTPVADSGTEGGSPRTDASVPPGDEGGPPRSTFAVGGVCARQSDCPAATTCLLPSSDKLGGGGPAQGLCTVECSTNGQADCDAVDPGSFCFVSDQVGYCFQGCTAGDPPLDTTKCRDRPDMACTPTSATSTGEGYCKPTCRGNSDCVPRSCDPRTGLCVDNVQGASPTGAACDPAAATNDCPGTCLTVGTPATKDNSMCTSACSLGASGACDSDPSATALPLTACLFTPFAGEGKGDIGACVQLCDCGDDCKNRSFVCTPISLSIGRPGMCVPATDAVGAPVPALRCTGSGGASGSGGSSGNSGKSSGGGTADAGTPAPKSDSGCGCHVGENPDGSRSGPLALAALGLALLRRRRSASAP
jgi:MYXO-CTERM domain-containing protein